MNRDQVFVIGAYGDPTAARQIITAKTMNRGTLDIANSGGWWIENLDVRNGGMPGNMNTTVRRGIFIHASNSGKHSNFTVRDNIVQRGNGSFMDKDNGGIIFLVECTNKPSWFTDVLIENNEIRDISGVGRVIGFLARALMHGTHHMTWVSSICLKMAGRTGNYLRVRRRRQRAVQAVPLH